MRPFKNRPDFFVIGAQRAGTTRLCHLLDAHPDVVIPTKEPFYFQSEDAVRRKAEWYRGLFENAGRGLRFGEGSTYYSMRDTYPGTAERIARFNPDARIIYMVRHPFRRIESAWYQLLSTREVSGLLGFKEAVLRSNALIEPTLYWRQLSAYREVFPDDQIRVYMFEDFARDEIPVAWDCLTFLGVVAAKLGNCASEGGKNTSASKRQPWRVVDLVKALPGYHRVKPLVPETVRVALGGRMQKPIRSVPRWDPELVEYVRGRVESDCHTMLDYVSRPRSLWNLGDMDPDAPDA